MQALYVIVTRSDVVQDILMGYISSGIQGATVYESHGLRELLPVDAPLFSRITHLTEGRKVTNRTIVTVIEDHQLRRALDIVQTALESLDGENSAFVYSVPVTFSNTLHGNKPYTAERGDEN